MAAPNQPHHLTTSTSALVSTSTPPQPTQPPVELDSHPITPHSPPPSSQQQSTTTTTTNDDGSSGRRPSIYTDPESMAKLRAERSGDPAVVDDPATNEPAAEDFAVAAGLEGERVGGR